MRLITKISSGPSQLVTTLQCLLEINQVSFLQTCRILKWFRVLPLVLKRIKAFGSSYWYASLKTSFPRGMTCNLKGFLQQQVPS